MKVDWPVLGRKLKSKVKDVKEGLSSVSSAEARKFLETKSIVVRGVMLGEADLQVYLVLAVI